MKEPTSSFALSVAAVGLIMLSPAPSPLAVGAPASEERGAMGGAGAPVQRSDLDLDEPDGPSDRRAEPPTICPAGGCPEEPEEPLICEMQQEIERKQDENLCEQRALHPELMPRFCMSTSPQLIPGPERGAEEPLPPQGSFCVAN